MEPEQWSRAEAVFLEALERPVSEQAAFVHRALADEPELATAVQCWLEKDAESASILDAFEPRAWAARRDPMLGVNLGGYRISELLGEGGMGVVYRAVRTDGAFEQTVAIKCLRAEKASQANIEHFLAERRTLAGLDHPNIGRLFDGGDTPSGTPYLVMEFVEGQPIDRYCDAQRLTVRDRLKLFATVCRAVHFAHRNLIVHRDIKPGNILVDADGRPKLVDFGIARCLGDGNSHAHAETSDRAWTPDYASPEQLQGERTTTAMDVYSLGVVLHQLLTGSLPRSNRVRHQGTPPSAQGPGLAPGLERPSQVVRRDAKATDSEAAKRMCAIAAQRGETPLSLSRQLAGDLDHIVIVALQEEPIRRYPSAEALGTDIERFLGGYGIAARSDSWTYRAVVFARKNRALVAACALSLCSFAVALGLALSSGRSANRAALEARDRAAVSADIAEFILDAFMTSPASEELSLIRAATDRIERHVRRVRFEYRDRPRPRADLLAELAEVYVRMGLYQEAGELHREALALRRRAFGPDSYAVSASLGALGSLLVREGRFDAALSSLRQALEIQRNHDDRRHGDVARVLNNLASCLYTLDRLQDAEVAHREALALRRDESPGSLAVAASANNLGVTLIGLGAYDEARELLDEALAIRRQVLTDRHRLTLQTRINLVALDWYMGPNHNEPGDLLETEALLRTLGRDGQTSLTTLLYNRSGMHIRRQEWEQASAAIDEALALHAERRTPDVLFQTRMLNRQAAAQEHRYDGPPHDR